MFKRNKRIVNNNYNVSISYSVRSFVKIEGGE